MDHFNIIAPSTPLSLHWSVSLNISPNMGTYNLCIYFALTIYTLFAFSFRLIFYLPLTLSQSHNFQYTDRIMHNAVIYSHMHNFSIFRSHSLLYIFPQFIELIRTCQSIQVDHVFNCTHLCIYAYG